MLGLSSLLQLCWAGEKGEEIGDFVTKSPLGTRKFQFVALFGLKYGIAMPKIKIDVCSNLPIFFSNFLVESQVNYRGVYFLHLFDFLSLLIN